MSPCTLATLFLALLIWLLPMSAVAQEVRPAPEVTGVLAGFEVPTPADWVEMPGVVAHVHGPPEQRPVLRALARHAAERTPALAASLGLPIGPRIHVYLAESEEQFHALQPGTTPDWADGTAYPLAGRIFLRRPGIREPGAAPLEQVLDHEIVHVLVGRAFAPQRPPRWLQEGLAKVYAGEHSPETLRTLTRSMVERDLYTLESLDRGFPADSAGARLAYAQSSDFISYLRATYGEQAVRELTRQMAMGAPLQVAIRGATGRWLDELDGEWRGRLEEGPGPLWLAGFFAEDGFWFLTGVMAFFALSFAWRRRRQRMADYAREERERDALIASLLGLNGADDDFIH